MNSTRCKTWQQVILNCLNLNCCMHVSSGLSTPGSQLLRLPCKNPVHANPTQQVLTGTSRHQQAAQKTRAPYFGLIAAKCCPVQGSPSRCTRLCAWYINPVPAVTALLDTSIQLPCRERAKLQNRYKKRVNIIRLYCAGQADRAGCTWVRASTA